MMINHVYEKKYLRNEKKNLRKLYRCNSYQNIYDMKPKIPQIIRHIL